MRYKLLRGNQFQNNNKRSYRWGLLYLNGHKMRLATMGTLWKFINISKFSIIPKKILNGNTLKKCSITDIGDMFYMLHQRRLSADSFCWLSNKPMSFACLRPSIVYWFSQKQLKWNNIIYQDPQDCIRIFRSSYFYEQNFMFNTFFQKKP